MKVLPLTDQTHFWRIPQLHNLELLHATYVTHAFDRHIHDGYAIGVIERGIEAFECEGVPHVARAGSLVVVNPGDLHDGQSYAEGGWTYRMLYPSTELVGQITRQLVGSNSTLPFFERRVIHNPELAACFHAMHRTLEQGRFLLENQTALMQALSQLIVQHGQYPLTLPTVGAEHRAVGQVRDYLQSHFAEDVSLDQLATLTSLSQYHLVRVFRAEVGLPPHAYLQQVRLHKARALLLHGFPPSHVATEVGFYDQSHLNRLFKRSVGITPGQFLANRNFVQYPNH